MSADELSTLLHRARTNRREFIRVATIAAGAFAAGCVVAEPDPDPTPTPTPSPTPTPPPHPCFPAPSDEWLIPSETRLGLPHLGGAPDTAVGRTVAAFVDTVVPGAWRDPEGSPGGLDVSAPALFFDPTLPAAEFVGVLAGFLDLVAMGLVEGETFATLSVEDRDEALQRATESLDLVELAIQLAKLAWFATETAGCVLGYPGANPGWIDDEDFSFGVAMAVEITVDGNYP